MVSVRLPARACLLACLLSCLSVPALAADELAVERGKALAERACSSCHVVNGGGGSDAVPTFHAIANTPRLDDARIRNVVYQPHADMPTLQLKERELDDLVAYIRSLAE